jgi:hypothetical protein
MHNVELALEAIWEILLWSLLLGAGLPVVFALGVRALAWGSDGSDQPDEHSPHLLARAAAALCFAVVLVSVALAITFIIASGFGKALDFEHVVPTLSDKA